MAKGKKKSSTAKGELILPQATQVSVERSDGRPDESSVSSPACGGSQVCQAETNDTGEHSVVTNENKDINSDKDKCKPLVESQTSATKLEEDGKTKGKGKKFKKKKEKSSAKKNNNSKEKQSSKQSSKSNSNDTKINVSNETKENMHTQNCDVTTNNKTKAHHVDELKIFQNHNLINQLDPIYNLQLQLNQIKENDDTKTKTKKDATTQLIGFNEASSQGLIMHQIPNGDSKNIFYKSNHHHLSESGKINQNNSSAPVTFFECNENTSTIKKGVLFEHQNYDRLSSKLFGRWKKRYFILTTDYLVSFKRSIPKVGQSEMGRFLYKVSSRSNL